MTMPELAVDTISIIIKGSFDPNILSPKELTTQGLVTADQVSEATQKFSTKDIAILETQGIRILANRELIQLTAQQADEFEPLRDLAVGMLRLFTNSESVSVLGINRDIHFVTHTINEWHSVGDRLVPKEVWADTLELAGTASLQIQAVRSNRYGGFRQVIIQPSNVVELGVFIEHNDHYTLEKVDKPPSTREQLAALAKRDVKATAEKIPIAIEVLNKEWEDSMARSAAVIERVAQEART